MPRRAPITSLSDLIAETLDATSKEDVYLLLRRFCAGLGAELVSYHRTMEGLRHLEFGDGFEFHSFPDAWVTAYEQRNYFEIDPIIIAARSTDRPFRWFEVGQLMRLSAEQMAFLDAVRSFGILDGFGIPVFSARGTAAYFGVGTCTGVLKLSDVQLLELSLACQVTHTLSLGFDPAQAQAMDEALTARETEILTCVARGKSNGEIAQALSISERTVDGTLRRVFAKLDVTDRVSATVRALADGIIQL